ncbi:hypothetical protein TELCIR_00472 [Teladorsagia circumcincta]|uniref:Uncharacterized protein n=1 Tax=Teladorsagia circumcincta TaxID=45464 RepID=A0A2G9V4M6_TELCI|nr:hypothetical protein TELCIR_00472 [Teladorsagia circumcincta]
MSAVTVCDVLIAGAAEKKIPKKVYDLFDQYSGSIDTDYSKFYEENGSQAAMPQKPTTSKSKASPNTGDDWMAPVLTPADEAEVEIGGKKKSKEKGKMSKGLKKTGSKSKSGSTETKGKSNTMNQTPKSRSKQLPMRKRSKVKKGSKSLSSTQSLDGETSRNSAAGSPKNKKGSIICGSKKKGSKSKGSKSQSKKNVRTPGPCGFKAKKGPRKKRVKKASKKKSKESDSKPPSSMTTSQSESAEEV